MQIAVQNFSRKNLIFLAMAFMVAGLFLSNGWLSVATILFVTAAVLNKEFFLQAKRAFSTPLLLGIMLLFLIPLLSGFWSHDKTEWLDLLRVKLPLLLFPLAFAGKWQLSMQQWKFIAILLLFAIVAATLYSFIQYLLDFAVVNKGYLSAKTLTTPFKNDHLRFSVLISICILLCFWLIENGEKATKTIAAFIALWLAIFLHIIAVRTGLLSFYIILLLYIVRILFVRKMKLFGPVLIIMLLLPILAYAFFPTFQNRIKYLVYDHSFINTGNYLPGSNDGSRVLSFKAGWEIIKDNPWGVGAGDIKNESKEWYHKNVPGMLDNDQLYPSSEWLMHGTIAGWIGVLVFTIIILFPFFVRNMPHLFYWRCLHLIIIISLLFDTGLGMQMGVFLYGFFVLAFWKWSKERAPMADGL